jgi:hypothetical protein
VSVQMRIALGTLCIFNAMILVVLGGAALWFVNGSAAPFLASALWLAAGMLLGLARHLRKGTEWGT